MTEVKVHEKYLIVIPKAIRKALGINIGETVEFVIEKGKAVLYPHREYIHCEAGSWDNQAQRHYR